MRNQSLEKLKKTMGICVAVGLFLVIGVVYLCTYHTYKNQYGKHHYTFGASYMTMNNDFYKVVNTELKDQIEKNGDHLIALDPALSQKKQNEQIKYLVDRGVDVIFLNPVDWKEVKSGLKAAKDAGIPVIVIDSSVYDDSLVDMTIVSDNYEAGVLCAKDMMKKKKSANIVLLTHEEAKSGHDRIQGFLDTIEENEAYHIIAKTDTKGQIERAMPKVNEIVKKYGNIDVIMALNDPAAMGALAALDSNSYEKEVLVYGVDGSPEGKKLIQEGNMEATAAQSPKQMGNVAIQGAYKILKGETIEKVNTISVELITKENVKNMDVSRWQ